MLQEKIMAEIHAFRKRNAQNPTGILLNYRTWVLLVKEIFTEVEDESELEKYESGTFEGLNFFRSGDIEVGDIKVF